MSNAWRTCAQPSGGSRVEGDVVTAGEGDAFDREYHRLSELGACDAVFGCEHGRVKREWNAAGQPKDIEAFIRWRANIGPYEEPL
jgi:hypothetical protein